MTTTTTAAAIPSPLSHSHKFFVDESSRILDQGIAYFHGLPNVVSAWVPTAEHEKLVVVGDVHGNYGVLQHLFARYGNPSSETRYIFNGDLVDRGPNGVMVVLTLLRRKLTCPSCVIIVRGNHEDEIMNRHYGFFSEVQRVYGREDGSRMFLKFQALFKELPLAALIRDARTGTRRAFVVHGGIPLYAPPDSVPWQSGIALIEMIQTIDRHVNPVPVSFDENYIVQSMLWSDPKTKHGVTLNEARGGVGLTFGPDATSLFLRINRVPLLIRSHQMQQHGYGYQHDNDCLLTVFSSPSYSGLYSNRGAVVIFDSTNDGHTIEQFCLPWIPESAPLCTAPDDDWQTRDDL